MARQTLMERIRQKETTTIILHALAIPPRVLTPAVVKASLAYIQTSSLVKTLPYLYSDNYSAFLHVVEELNRRHESVYAAYPYVVLSHTAKETN